jgi:hypothetical protein
VEAKRLQKSSIKTGLVVYKKYLICLEPSYILSRVSVTKTQVWIGESAGSLLIVTTISSYTLKITVTIAQVTSHSMSFNSSGHTALTLELRNSSEFNSSSRILSYPLGTDHAQKT